MEIIISAAVSADGYMDDCSPQRLIISDEEDWAEVHALRASCDAILVGAETLRRDDPALVIRDERLRSARVAAGKRADITKVTITGNGNLDASLRFFKEGGADIPKIVFIRRGAPPHNVSRLAQVAEVVELDVVSVRSIVGELSSRGIGRLMVEGGPKVIKMFIDEGMADWMRLAVAPFTVGEERAPRLPYFGNLPFEEKARKNVRKVGNMTVTEYVIRPE